jgi:hypothetical protein
MDWTVRPLQRASGNNSHILPKIYLSVTACYLEEDIVATNTDCIVVHLDCFQFKIIYFTCTKMYTLFMSSPFFSLINIK